jgi:hypothetical protein
MKHIKLFESFNSNGVTGVMSDNECIEIFFGMVDDGITVDRERTFEMNHNSKFEHSNILTTSIIVKDNIDKSSLSTVIKIQDEFIISGTKESNIEELEKSVNKAVRKIEDLDCVSSVRMSTQIIHPEFKYIKVRYKNAKLI